MKIKLVGATNNISGLTESLRFSRMCARVCYSEKDWEDLAQEAPKPELISALLKRGHHSVFDHLTLTLYMQGIPKALAMILNNERDYNTSEKSARFTQMNDISPAQRELYDKWMNILIPEIDKVYPTAPDSSKRNEVIKKLAQENARYMTSVFTPTKMVHTLGLRQLNFLIYEFEKFIATHNNNSDVYKQRLSQNMAEFLAQIPDLKIEGLHNQTDRHLSFFNPAQVEEHFGSTYSTSYLMSFAGFGQAQRHRTLEYHVSSGTELGAPYGFFVPALITQNQQLQTDWIANLNETAKTDFPQAQLLTINESGSLRNFRSKLILRLCGHAQYEIMAQTKRTAEKYALAVPQVKKWETTKCSQGMPCPEPCVWGSKKALERLV